MRIFLPFLLLCGVVIGGERLSGDAFVYSDFEVFDVSTRKNNFIEGLWDFLRAMPSGRQA